MKRNWNYILSLSCRPTQVALATCSDENVLARLRHVFPKAFAEGQEETIGPWSMIRAKWEAHCAKTYESPPVPLLFTAWGEAVEVPFDLRFGKFGSNKTNKQFHRDGPIPPEVRQQLQQLAEIWTMDDDWFTKPIVIRYLDRAWIISLIRTEHGGMWGLPSDDGDGEVFLVPREHIIFDL